MGLGGDAERDGPDATYPESRVLIIMTGGTICMRPSPDGLVPMDGFLKNAMAPRPSFNDMSPSGKLDLQSYNDHPPPNGNMLAN